MSFSRRALMQMIGAGAASSVIAQAAGAEALVIPELDVVVGPDEFRLVVVRSSSSYRLPAPVKRAAIAVCNDRREQLLVSNTGTGNKAVLEADEIAEFSCFDGKTWVALFRANKRPVPFDHRFEDQISERNADDRFDRMP